MLTRLRLIANITRCFFWLGWEFYFTGKKLLVYPIHQGALRIGFAPAVNSNDSGSGPRYCFKFLFLLILFLKSSWCFCIYAFCIAQVQVQRAILVHPASFPSGNGVIMHSILSFLLHSCELPIIVVAYFSQMQVSAMQFYFLSWAGRGSSLISSASLL